MEIMLDSGLLGEFDYHGDTIELPELEKPKIVKGLTDILGFIAFGIGAFIAFIIFILILGSCMGCDSCVGCLDECGSCVSCSCGTKCSECGRECRGGCGCSKCDDDNDKGSTSSSGSGCSRIKTKTEVYHIVYEDGEEADLIYATSKRGCSVVDRGFQNFGDIARDERFFSEEGYYKKDSFKDKDLVIAASGEIVGKLKDGETYYSKSHELYVGEERTIKIIFEGGSEYPITATVGEQIVKESLPAIPTKEGYEFDGGYCNDYKVIASSGELINPVFHLYNYGSVDQVLSVELRYVPKTYTGTVYINSKQFSMAIQHDDLLKTVIDKAQGFITSSLTADQEFIGWSFTNKESELIADSTMNTQRINQNITLYAIVKSKKTITLDYNNGTAAGSTKVVQGRLSPLPTEGFTKTGYDFVGWCKNKDLSDEPFTEITVEENTTVYAKWAPKNYVINYRSGIDDHILLTGEYTYSETTESTLAQYNNAWTPNGYEFSGWATSKTATKYITALPKNTHGDIDIYAIYSSEKFTVSLDEGYGSLSITSKQIEYGSSFVLPVPTISDASKEFIGFYYNDIQVTDKTGASIIKYTETALKTTYIKLSNITLTAKFDTKRFTIHFYKDSTALFTDTVLYNEQISSHEAPIKEGYSFTGWSKDKNKYVAYDFTSKVTSKFDLYAHYSPKSYTVTLAIKPSDSSFGTLTTTTFDILYDQSFTLPKPNTDVAYNFVCYKMNALKITDSNGVSLKAFNTTNLNTTITNIENGLTFTAEFAIKTFSVKYYYDSNLIDTKTVDYGESAENKVLTTIPTGYEFKGWTINLNTKVLYDFEQSTVTEALNLYAVVVPMKFNITLSISGAYGMLTNTSAEVDYDSIYSLPVPELNEGFKFVGYYYNNVKMTNETGTSLNKFTTAAFGNLTIAQLQAGLTFVAKCEEIEYTVSYYFNGKVLEQKAVSFGGTATEIPSPDLELGYRFIGWSTQENGKELYDFSTVLTKDLKLYAVVSNKYKVTLYASDQVTVLKEFEVTYGSTWSIPTVSNLPASWQGWFLFGTNERIANKNGAIVADYANFNFTEDIKIYIKE